MNAPFYYLRKPHKLPSLKELTYCVIWDFSQLYKADKQCFIPDSELLEKLCLSLYDVLRPLIIHIIHLETLSELCSILKNEMLEDHVHNNGMLEVLFSLEFLKCHIWCLKLCYQIPADTVQWKSWTPVDLMIVCCAPKLFFTWKTIGREGIVSQYSKKKKK